MNYTTVSLNSLHRKLLSVVVPCYNSEAYMKKCVDSLLIGGDEVEIIIVDDGSKDSTGQIADMYAEKYPSIVSVIHQDNGGHGEAINAGLRNSSGIYFKVVDSDDWVSKDAYLKLLDIMRVSVEENEQLDMLIANYIYDKQGTQHKKVMSYKNALPANKYFTWDDVGNFYVTQYILMHSVIYRTRVLRDCGLELPGHTFYVDNLFLFVPLPYVKKMYYIDEVFYHYFIGRDDQSVNEAVMIKRIDQQIDVTKKMIDYFDYDKLINRRCVMYMQNYINIMMTVSSIFLVLSKEEMNYQKKHMLWDYLKEQNPRLYREIRHTAMGYAISCESRAARSVQCVGYKLSQKAIGFN